MLLLWLSLSISLPFFLHDDDTTSSLTFHLHRASGPAWPRPLHNDNALGRQKEKATAPLRTSIQLNLILLFRFFIFISSFVSHSAKMRFPSQPPFTCSPGPALPQRSLSRPTLHSPAASPVRAFSHDHFVYNFPPLRLSTTGSLTHSGGCFDQQTLPIPVGIASFPSDLVCVSLADEQA